MHADEPLTIKRGETLLLTAPEGATLLNMAGAGHKVGPVDVVDGVAVVSADDTKASPAGEYRTEWRVVDAQGNVSLPSGQRVVVQQSLDVDSLNTIEPTQYERILQAAKDALESAAASGDVSVSTGDTTFTFETRAELLSFVNRLEKLVARRRGRKPASKVWRL